LIAPAHVVARAVFLNLRYANVEPGQFNFRTDVKGVEIVSRACDMMAAFPLPPRA